MVKTAAALVFLFSIFSQSAFAGNKALPRTCDAINDPKWSIGEATWYSYEENGPETASGDIFDEDEMTAAHRTLPFNSIVEVHWGDRSVRVRINDAGPFSKGRIIDLSVAAAKELGMYDNGTADVRLELIHCGDRD